ncbi:hypothetical protein D3C78_1890680 [compost metagenome]
MENGGANRTFLSWIPKNKGYLFDLEVIDTYNIHLLFLNDLKIYFIDVRDIQLNKSIVQESISYYIQRKLEAINSLIDV